MESAAKPTYVLVTKGKRCSLRCSRPLKHLRNDLRRHSVNDWVILFNAISKLCALGVSLGTSTIFPFSSVFRA